MGFRKSVFQPVQSSTSSDDLRKKALLECYGSSFKYNEFQVMSSAASVVVYTVALAFGLGMLLVNPVSHNDAEVCFFFADFYSGSLSCKEVTSAIRGRSLRKVSRVILIIPPPLVGLLESRSMQKGFFKVTNITTSTSSSPIQVKTIIKGKGDPGYLLTSGMLLVHFFFGSVY